MLKEKRSFLGKFTHTDEPEQPKMQQQIQNQSMPVYSDDEEMQVSFDQNRQAAPAPLQQQAAPMTQPNQQQTWQEEEEESGDIEGQLTIDVYQTESDIVIKSTIAGVKPENLDVGINNDMITIKGDRINEEEAGDDDYFYQECYWGSFSRSLVLPMDVLVDKIDATLKNGILTIRLPKADNTKTKKIQVRGF